MRALLINYSSSEKDFRLPIVNYFLQDFYQIDKCLNPLWVDTKTRITIAKNPFFIYKYLLKEIPYLIKIIIKMYRNNYDLIIVGYPAYFEALIIKVFGTKRIKPKVYVDFFISVYDTFVLDRKLVSQNSLNAKISYLLDKRLLKSSERIIVDTQANVNRYAEMFMINKNKFCVLFVGSNNLITCPSFKQKAKKDKTLHIGWVGHIIPLHGIKEIIECAAIVKSKDIKFHLIGNGPYNELDHIKNEINSLGLGNIILYDELDYEKTMNILNECDICLGIFGESNKAKAVIPFKLFDYLYLNKPIITQYSDSITELSEFNEIYTVNNKAIAIANQLHKIKLNKPINNRDILLKTIRRQYEEVFFIR